ncbi:MAG TPA: CapA family protein [Candidatus Babeliales bacterium]|nr:CapA family protein [Candidatus Babeliales bacterium]
MKSIKTIIGIGIIIIVCALIAGYHKTKSESPTVTIGFAGDVMLGRSVSDILMRLPTTIRYRYPWGSVLPLLQANDLNIINLETTLTTSTHIEPKTFNFKADPDLVKALHEAHIDVVNIANNHILDFSNEGLFETIKVLDAAGIQHVGAGKDIYQAQKAVIIQKHGIKIGIIGFTDNEPEWQAGQDHPGTNYIQVGDIDTIKKDIQILREAVDVLILTIHWGPNKSEQPTKEFRDFAHQIIDEGVDIIHGHSAHLVNGIELYNDKLIMYQTGDFVDDYALYEDARNDLSFLFVVTIDKNGPIQVKLTPTAIANAQVNIATGKDQHYIEQHMEKLCNQLGTSIDTKGIIKIR